MWSGWPVSNKTSELEDCEGVHRTKPWVLHTQMTNYLHLQGTSTMMWRWSLARPRGKTSETLSVHLSNLTEKSVIGFGRRWARVGSGSTGMGALSCEGMNMKHWCWSVERPHLQKDYIRVKTKEFVFFSLDRLPQFVHVPFETNRNREWVLLAVNQAPNLGGFILGHYVW